MKLHAISRKNSTLLVTLTVSLFLLNGPMTSFAIAGDVPAQGAKIEALLARANGGDVNAQFEISFVYALGKGLPQSDTEAFMWLRRAAENGNVLAQGYLGFIYLDSDGGAQHNAEAVKWLTLAAGQDFAEAQHNLGVIYFNGIGVPKNDSEAAKWYRLAAEQGYAESQYNLGLLYANGEGVPRDFVRASAWLGMATANGVDQNKDLNSLWPNMNAKQIAAAQALATRCLESDYRDCD